MVDNITDLIDMATIMLTIGNCMFLMGVLGLAGAFDELI